MWLSRKTLRQQKPSASPLFADTYSYYGRAIDEIADTLPWLGKDPFTPSGSRHVPRPAIEDGRFVRRVLISWQIGRPVSQVAERAGCSPRLVLNIIRSVIYRTGTVGSDDFRSWRRLGLLAPVDGSEFVGAEDRTNPWKQIHAAFLPVVCLVCHWFVGIVEPGRAEVRRLCDQPG